MPCRALEAFRRIRRSFCVPRILLSLNALSGIGGVQTRQEDLPPTAPAAVLMPCRALEAFRRTPAPADHRPPPSAGLNALSGIGGVQTDALCGTLLPRGVYLS